MQPTETVKKKEVTEKKKTSVRLYNPIPKEELTSDNPIVKVAKNWDNISRTMCNSAGYLKAALMNRDITIASKLSMDIFDCGSVLFGLVVSFSAESNIIVSDFISGVYSQ